MTSIKIPEKLRRRVIQRANSLCEYCCMLADYSSTTFPIDHVIPRAKGGATVFDNLALACGGCNGAKLDKVEAIDPILQDIVPIYNPRIHRWHEHFEWSEDYLYMIGRTPIGRATILILDLNREGLVNLREVLALAGKHPPLLNQE
jgi:hypothetical protein